MYFKESTTVAIFKHFFLDTETCTGVLKKKKRLQILLHSP